MTRTRIEAPFTMLSIGVRLTEPLLGTVSLNPDIYRDYIMSKAPVPEDCEDELETLGPDDIDELLQRNTTGFHQTDDGYGLYGYVIKGHIKEAWKSLAAIGGMQLCKVKAWRQRVNTLVHIEPRFLQFRSADGRFITGELQILERPLRASTPKGERVAIARSQTVPPDTTIDFRVKLIGDIIIPAHILECLTFGEDYGLGQWRNAGFGRYIVEEFGIISG